MKSKLEESSSFKDFLRRIGYAASGNAYKHTKAYLSELGLTYSFPVGIKWDTTEKSVEDTFRIGSNKMGTKGLKKKILKYELKEYACEGCGNDGTWKGSPLSLHLDHINGNTSDNRLENLRFLCPNCHSQTDTYAGKNKKK